MADKTWDELKKEGSEHYQTGEIEPIDLYKSIGIFRDWAIGEICQHALRNRSSEKEILSANDMKKIIHYAELLAAESMEQWKFIKGGD